MTAAGYPLPGRALNLLVVLAGGAVLAAPVVWTLNPLGIVRAHFLLEQYLALELALALCFVLASAAQTAAMRAFKMPLLGSALAALAVGSVLAVHFGSDNALFIQPTPWILGLAVGLITLALLGLSLTGGGRDMLLLVLGMLAFGYLAQFVGGFLSTAPIEPSRYLVYLVFSGDGFLGRALEVMATVVAIYLLFGAAYEISGGTAALDALANRLAGRGRGASVKATVISSALFGIVSGSATSNVVTSGAFTIPAMKRMGIRPAMAGGIEAVSSTIGQVTPPVLGTAAFLMADLTGLPYPQIALAAAIPALICYAVMVHQGTWIGNRTVATAPEVGLPSAQKLSRLSLVHLLPVGTILGVMLLGDRMTSFAGVMGALVALAVGLLLFGPRGVVQRFRRVAGPAARSITSLIVAGSALGVVVGVLNITGLDVALTLYINQVGQANLVLALLLTGAAAFLLGTGMSTSGVYIVVGTLLAPGLIKLGLPAMSAHLFVLYAAMLSMITPPIAFAALAASSVSGASFSSTTWASMRFGWIAFVVPVAFVAQPALVLVGSPMQLAYVTGSIVLSLWAARRIVAPRSKSDLLLAAASTLTPLAVVFFTDADAGGLSAPLFALSIALSLLQSR